MNRRRRQMLEVVEVEERARPVQRVGDRVEERALAGLADADRARDRVRDEIRIGDRSETDEVHGPVERCSRRDLECQAALARTARACDRHEPHIGLVEERFDACQCVRTADEPVVERRQAGRRQCSQRRELVAKVRREELEQMDGGRDVLQAMPSERSIRAIGNGRFSGHVACCP